MADGLHILIWNRAKIPLAIALGGVGRGLMGRDDGDNVTNVQYKSNQDCHFRSLPLYNEYILITNLFKRWKSNVCKLHVLFPTLFLQY
jgi:hypothetical protein